MEAFATCLNITKTLVSNVLKASIIIKALSLGLVQVCLIDLTWDLDDGPMMKLVFIDMIKETFEVIVMKQRCWNV